VVEMAVGDDDDLGPDATNWVARRVGRLDAVVQQDFVVDKKRRAAYFSPCTMNADLYGSFLRFKREM